MRGFEQIDVPVSLVALGTFGHAVSPFEVRLGVAVAAQFQPYAFQFGSSKPCNKRLYTCLFTYSAR
jgi:hypothetical protein